MKIVFFQNRNCQKQLAVQLPKGMERKPQGHQNGNYISGDEVQRFCELDCNPENLCDLLPGREKKPLAQR